MALPSSFNGYFRCILTFSLLQHFSWHWFVVVGPFFTLAYTEIILKALHLIVIDNKQWNKASSCDIQKCKHPILPNSVNFIMCQLINFTFSSSSLQFVSSWMSWKLKWKTSVKSRYASIKLWCKMTSWVSRKSRWHVYVFFPCLEISYWYS